MRISAVIPTYNRQADVVRAIESVLAQTTPVAEIILIDDGSTDNTVANIREKFGASVTIIQQQNAGVSAARNRGIEAARNNWIAFLDSDDIWFPEKTERQLEALRLAGSRAGLCFTNNLYGGNPQMGFSRFEETGFVNAPKFGVIDHPARYILTGREPFFTSTLLIQRSLLVELGGFDESLLIREDTDLLLRLALRTAFAFAGEPLGRIDRTPSRELGLCNLYGTRVDTLFQCSERLYRNWLSLPEVKGTEYEQPIRALLRLAHYDSAEAKIHDLRLKAAVREIQKIRVVGEGYARIAATLLVRKVQKWRRSRGQSKVSGQKREQECVLKAI